MITTTPIPLSYVFFTSYLISLSSLHLLHHTISFHHPYTTCYIPKLLSQKDNNTVSSSSSQPHLLLFSTTTSTPQPPVLHIKILLTYKNTFFSTIKTTNIYFDYSTNIKPIYHHSFSTNSMKTKN